MKKLVLTLLIAATVISYGCGGSQTLSSPKRFATVEKNEPTTETKIDSTIQIPVNEKEENKEFASTVLNKTKETVVSKKETTQLKKHNVTPNETIENIYYSSVDVDDSASAVDDDLWRQFDLAEEYHAMGVVAKMILP